MKITIFTSNNYRHNNLVNEIGKIADEIFVIQECNTLFPGKVSDFRIKNRIIKKYFEKVSDAQKKIFNNEPISLKNKTNILSIKYGDLNFLSLNQLKDFLKSDIYIVFGSSFIKGDLVNFLNKKRQLTYIWEFLLILEAQIATSGQFIQIISNLLVQQFII